LHFHIYNNTTATTTDINTPKSTAVHCSGGSRGAGGPWPPPSLGPQKFLHAICTFYWR